MSTSVAKGQGKAVVYATGMETQFGKIASLTQTIKEEESPLQKEIASMAKYDFIIAIIVGVVFFIVSYFLTRFSCNKHLLHDWCHGMLCS